VPNVAALVQDGLAGGWLLDLEHDGFLPCVLFGRIHIGFASRLVASCGVRAATFWSPVEKAESRKQKAAGNRKQRLGEKRPSAASEKELLRLGSHRMQAKPTMYRS